MGCKAATISLLEAAALLGASAAQALLNDVSFRAAGAAAQSNSLVVLRPWPFFQNFPGFQRNRHGIRLPKPNRGASLVGSPRDIVVDAFVPVRVCVVELRIVAHAARSL